MKRRAARPGCYVLPPPGTLASSPTRSSVMPSATVSTPTTPSGWLPIGSKPSAGRPSSRARSATRPRSFESTAATAKTTRTWTGGRSPASTWLSRTRASPGTKCCGARSTTTSRGRPPSTWPATRARRTTSRQGSSSRVGRGTGYRTTRLLGERRADPTGSAERGGLYSRRLDDVRLATHPERDEQTEESGEERHEQRHLERDRPDLRVDADDLGLDVCRLADELFLELGVRHQLRVAVQRLGDLLLLGRAEHPAGLGRGSEREGRGSAHDAARHRKPERQAERSSRRVDAGRLTDALLGDRRQRVVVEL